MRIKKGRRLQKEDRGNDEVDDENFFSDPKLWATVDEIVAAFKFNPPAGHIPNKHTMRKKRSPKDASMPSFKILDSEEELPSTQECSTPIAAAFHCTPPGHTVASTSGVVPEKTSLVTSKHIERRSPRLSPEVITPIASLPPPKEVKMLHKRAKDVSVVFKSPFIERNINVFSELTQSEKEVADYGFAEGLNNREVLFNCGIHKLHRYELKTMMCGEMVSKKVLHAWAHMLNEREKLRAPESMCRLYLSFRNEISYEGVDFDKVSLNVRADTHLKRLKMKFCYAILTWENNSLKEKVQKNAKSMRSARSEEEIGKQTTFTDDQIFDFILKLGRDDKEVVIDTEWGQAIRLFMKSLFPNNCLFDTVIDLAGIYATHSRSDVIFIPTSIRFITSTDCVRIFTNIKTSYMPANASLCKQMFLPLLSPNPDHWFLCVSDLTLKTNFILDSSPPRRTTVRNEKAATVVANVAEIISRIEGFERRREISLFKYVNVKVPRQDNGDDCGIYVIKWIEALMDHSLWTNKQYFKNLDEYKKNLVIKLLRWDKN